MHFYYYSNVSLDYVKSLRKLGDLTQSDIDVSNKQATLTDAVGASVDAVKLFVYPLGKDQILGSKMVDDSQPVYENEIDITTLPINIAWALKDTKEYLLEKKRYGEDSASHMNKWAEKHGHAGRGIASLQKALKKYATNVFGRPNNTTFPYIEFYPYTGYFRVTRSSLKAFS
jgi:hypothetical protein